jgi:hypothetical protein
MLLSIDVGIKNLAMCLIDPSTKKIQKWDVSGIPPQSTQGLFPSLKKHVDARIWATQTPSVVIIEKQPDKNKTMKSVEHFLHTYFLCHDKDVVIWDARHKIPDVSGPGRTMYLQRKKTSIERCRMFLMETNEAWLSFFDTHKKKDDLADTCMQALSFIDRIPQKEKDKKKKQTPRRPTEHQRNTKYSRSNLAWLYMHGEHETARFRKDLARYYASIEELFQEFTIEHHG